MIDSHRDEIAKLESLYAMNPEGRVFTHLAEACRKAGQLDRARQILEEGLQKHPDYASAHVVLGRVLADLGEDDAAVGEFRRVLELDRHNLVALRSLGELAARAGRNDEASHYYGELAVLDPTDPQIQDTLRRLSDRAAAGGAPARAEPAAADPGEASAGAESAPEPDRAAIGPEPTAEPAELPPGTATAAIAAGDPDRPPESDEPVAEAPSAEEEASEPAGIGISGAEEPVEDTSAVSGIRIEGIESFDAPVAGDVEPVDGLETATFEPEPSDERPSAAGPADFPEWPAAEAAGEVEQPGEDAPIDHAAWRQIAAGALLPEAPAVEPSADDVFTTSPSGDEPSAAAKPDAPSSGADEDESEPFVAASGEVTMPLDEDHLRFAPPGLFGAPVPQTHEATDAADAGPDAGSGEGEPESEDEVSPAAEESGGTVEGRWRTPESSHGDAQAERERPVDHSGEWIPEDRWEWVAASADASGSTGTPDAEEEPDGESSPEPAARAATDGFDEETSFAGLTDDEDAPAAWGIDEETSFAGLTDDEEEAAPGGSDEVVPFADLAESGPVDSFEEGAATVLDPYTGAYESDDAPAEHGFVTSPAVGDEDAPVSWVTESEDDGDLVITETLAEIYASQGLYDRAAAVYRRLMEQHPDDDRLHARLAELESTTDWGDSDEPASGDAEDDREAFLERVESAWTGGEGAANMEDSPYAWALPEPEEAETGPRVADYFAGLLAWRPTEAVPSTGIEPAGAGPAPMVEDWYAEESDREPAEAGGETEVGREGEEDLEMFRSWLKSLKK